MTKPPSIDERIAWAERRREALNLDLTLFRRSHGPHQLWSEAETEAFCTIRMEYDRVTDSLYSRGLYETRAHRQRRRDKLTHTKEQAA